MNEPGHELAESDKRLLEFAATAPLNPRSREAAIRRELGLLPISYYRRLNLLIDDPSAWREYPDLMARLDRLRDSRASSHNPPAGDYTP